MHHEKFVHIENVLMKISSTASWFLVRVHADFHIIERMRIVPENVLWKWKLKCCSDIYPSYPTFITKNYEYQNIFPVKTTYIEFVS